MRDARTATVTTTLIEDPPRPARLPLDAALQAPPPPTPLPRPGPADRICEALRRWLEEDM